MGKNRRFFTLPARNLLTTGVQKAVAEKGILGALTGGLTASAAGITAAMIFGLLVALIFNPGDKS